VDGGVIFNYCDITVGSGTAACVLNLNNCILTGNTAGRDGGAISNQCTINVNSPSNPTSPTLGACVLNLNKCILTGNTAGRNGGTISNQCTINVNGPNDSFNPTVGACVLNMNDCTLTSNNAFGDGGAISNQCTINVISGIGACVLNVNDCKLTGNTAGGNGGVISNHCTVNAVSGLGTCVLNVNRGNLTGNSAMGDGGTIWNNGKGNIHLNRIVFNTAHRANAIYSDNTMDATDNWWGSNNNPKNIINNFGGQVDLINADPWLILTIKASPTSIPFGGTSTVTASVTLNSDGVDTSSMGHIPDGTLITITTDLGNVGSKSVMGGTVAGIFTAILRANEGWGVAHLYAILDWFMTPKPATVVIAAPAKTTGKTIAMKETGLPLTGIVLGILMVVGGFLGTEKRIK
jgi:autotransporter family porin